MVDRGPSWCRIPASRQARHPHPRDLNYTLRLDWTGNSGESYINVVTFSVKGSKVTTMSTSANADGVILRGGPRNWSAFTTYTLEQGRRFYKRCLADGYKPVDQQPELTYAY